MENAKSFNFDRQLKKNKIMVLILSVIFDIVSCGYILLTDYYKYNAFVVVAVLTVATLFSFYILSVFTVSCKKDKVWYIAAASVFPVSVTLYILAAHNNIHIFIGETGNIIATLIVCFVLLKNRLEKNGKWKGVKDVSFIKTIVRLSVIFFSATIILINVFMCINIASYEKNREPVLFQHEIKMTPTVKATKEAKYKDNSYTKYYMNDLTPLIYNGGKNLTEQEMLDIAQIVTNIYTTYYGLSEEISLCLVDMDDGEGSVALGAYSHYHKMIMMNSKYFGSMDSERMLNVVLHEFYHAYQHDQAEIINYLPEEKQNLKLLAEAKVFKEGFESYIDGKDDFESYENQYVELSADYFAEEETDELLRIISELF